MDIFNGNRKLEDAVMYGLDWGVFLRHDLDGPIAPFMYLFNGDQTLVRVLMTDENPMEYALKVLEGEKEPYQQFVIGIEGFLRSENEERVDAIIVHGYDKTQEQGVILGQMFEPKETNGAFRKIDKVSYLGSSDLPIALEKVENPDYSTEDIGFSAMSLKFGELIQYLSFYTHNNPSVIANSMKMFLRSKLMDADASKLSGRFEFVITPGEVTSEDLLKFLAINAITEEREEAHAKDWEQNTGRKLLFNVRLGDTDLFSEFENESNSENDSSEQANSTQGEQSSTNTTEDSIETEKQGGKYAGYSQVELDNEYYRIISIPNARTDITALRDMAELMSEYEKRGVQMPGSNTSKPKASEKKPWWKFW